MKPADTRIAPETRVRLSKWDPTITDIIGKDKSDAREQLDEYRARLEALQELLYAEGKHKLLVVLQAMDTGGKDGTIRHVFRGVDPQGVKVTSFKAPTDVRAGARLPVAGASAGAGRGRDRHLQPLALRGRAGGAGERLVDAAECERRYRQINDFERMLAENGTTILKFFLHISKDEQKKRLQARLDDPAKALEIPSGRSRRAQVLGRLHGRLRGRAVGDQHRLRALVRHSCQLQARPQPVGVEPAIEALEA